MKRFISLSLLLALMLSQISCGSGSTQGNDTSSADTTTQPVDTTPAEISDDLPDVKFGGRTFTTLTYGNMKSGYIADEANGDVINDAVYKRNQTVMERFDVKLETIYEEAYNDTTKRITNTVLAGDDDFQLIAHHIVSLGTLVLDDLMMNWYDVPHIDFSKPWWSDSTVEDLTYDGTAIIAVGDYSLSSLSATWAYFYDKQAAEDYHFEDLYDVVYDGKWTMDYVNDLVKDIYVDLNGNGNRDEFDFYGYTTTVRSDVNAALWASGGKVFRKDSEGKLKLDYYNDKTVSILEKLYQLCYENDGVCIKRSQYPSDKAGWHAAYSFSDNLTAMIPGTLELAVENFRENKHEYGILPFPKYDEDQEEYYTMTDGSFAALAIPKTVTDTEFVGVITEALNAESNKIVFPAYYEVALKVKYAHDDESVKMLDMIVDGRIFDFGYVYDGWKGMSFYYQHILAKQSKDLASHYAQNGPSAEEYYNEVIEYFEGLTE